MEKYGSKHALKSPPHVTLHMPFKYKDKRYDQLQEFMSSVTREQTNFSLTLRDFDCFEPRVIFVDVKPSNELEQLQGKIVKEIRKLNILNAQYKSRAFHPHMTIAFRDLKKPVFYDVWQEFSDKKYKATFEINDICLLKHDGQQWNIHQRFPFT